MGTKIGDLVSLSHFIYNTDICGAADRYQWYSIIKVIRMGTMIIKEIKYYLHYTGLRSLIIKRKYMYTDFLQLLDSVFVMRFKRAHFLRQASILQALYQCITDFSKDLQNNIEGNYKYKSARFKES